MIQLGQTYYLGGNENYRWGSFEAESTERSKTKTNYLNDTYKLTFIFGKC